MNARAYPIVHFGTSLCSTLALDNALLTNLD